MLDDEVGERQERGDRELDDGARGDDHGDADEKEAAEHLGELPLEKERVVVGVEELKRLCDGRSAEVL